MAQRQGNKLGRWDTFLDKLSSIASKAEYGIEIIRYMARAVRDFPRYRDYRDSKKNESTDSNEHPLDDGEVPETAAANGRTE